MKLKFKSLVTLTAISDFDEQTDEIREQEEVAFQPGEVVEVDIVDKNQIQFSDGSVAFVTDSFWDAVETEIG